MSDSDPTQAQSDIEVVPPKRAVRGAANPLSPIRIRARLRRNSVIEMRARGMRWPDIDAELGLANGTSRKIAQRWREHESEPDLDTQRAELGDAIDQVLIDLRDGKVDDKVASALLRGLSLKAGVFGLKAPAAPTKVEHSGKVEHEYVPLSPEETLAAAEELTRVINSAADKKADAVLAQRNGQDRSLPGATTTDPPSDPSIEDGEIVEDGE